jgi:hypothetical protein
MLTLEETQISIKEWEALTLAEQMQYVRLLEADAHQLRTLLNMVPCPTHGECIPYFRDWVRKHVEAEAHDG